MKKLDANCVLFVTLDSCRYDAFTSAQAPHLKSLGPLYKATAPSHFTFGSHAAMFVGFTPGVANVAAPYVNPKFGKIFKMSGGGFSGLATPHMQLEGADILDGHRRAGYAVLGSGAVGWFNPATATGAVLSRGFDEFFFPGNTHSLQAQVDWAYRHIELNRQKPIFLFMNIGETHVPYYYDSAPWDPDYNPCIPFGANNDRDECMRRQIACVEFVDSRLAGLLELFSDGTTIVCADHGDCWGEDGLWEHGIGHPKVFEVPLLFRLGGRYRQDAEVA
mgnify:CR=1 FL=1